MEQKALEQSEKKAQKIQLVKGEFTPSEASDIISALIDEKINFHKIQRLQFWEGNHKGETKHLNGRILELEQEKKNAKQFIIHSKSLGKKLKINGTLEITLID